MSHLHWTEEQFRQHQSRVRPSAAPAHTAQVPPKKKRSKFANTRTETEDGTFDSAREAKRFEQLKLLARGREITALQRQVRFDLNDGGTYVADFVYLDRRKREWIVEDCKGYRTPEYIRKRRLMKEIHGLAIVET